MNQNKEKKPRQRLFKPKNAEENKEDNLEKNLKQNNKSLTQENNDKAGPKQKHLAFWLVACVLSIVIVSILAPASEHYDPELIAAVSNSEKPILQPSNVDSSISAEPSEIPITEIKSSGVIESPSPEPTEKPRQRVSDEMNYVDDTTEIHIEKVEKENLVYYLSEIKIESPRQFKTALAQNKFGNNYRAYSSKIAADNNAILACNGDYYGFRKQGIVIRNGQLYRDQAAKNSELLIIDSNGDFRIETESEIDAQGLVDEGVMHTLSFGPALVKEGKLALPESFFLSLRAKEPRTAIGQKGPLHYLIISVDGRRKGHSDGVTLEELGQLFVEQGCHTAYNLDGGGSATLVMNGQVINRVSGGGERSVSDIVYFTSMD